MALGVHVGHVVTCHDSPEGSLIHTVFTKKWQKRSKRGGYPILTTFWEEFTFLGTPNLSLGSRMSILSPFSHPKGTKIAL